MSSDRANQPKERSKVVFLSRAQRVADSPEVQAKLKAGTHRLGRLKQPCTVELKADETGREKIVSTPILRADGSPFVESFNLWKVPKRERPQCGARCRDGSSCRARVAVKADGSFHKRCRMHGAASPLATGDAPVKARLSSLEETSEVLRTRIAQMQGHAQPPVRTIEFLTELLAEFEATAELLQTGPAQAKKRGNREPRPKRFKAAAEVRTDEEMHALLRQIGVL